MERLAVCHQLLDYLFYILVELSSFAVGFHELMDSKNVNHLLVDCSQWPHIHFCYILIRYLIDPICGGSLRVFVKICNNRELFQSNRDQNGGYAAISCHVVASGGRCGRGLPPPTGGVRGASPGKILKF